MTPSTDDSDKLRTTNEARGLIVLAVVLILFYGMRDTVR